MQIIRSTDFKTTLWSGGTTTELFIYPPDSEYAKRNFAFRLSRATVEVEKSDFTPLPGVRRKLMVLEGELELIHKNHHTKKLQPLQFDVFPGDWETQSIGRATDLNLMLMGTAEGGFSVVESKEKRSFNLEIQQDFTLLYVLYGALTYAGIKLNKGDLLVLDDRAMEPLSFILEEQSVIIATQMNLSS